MPFLLLHSVNNCLITAPPYKNLFPLHPEAPDTAHEAPTGPGWVTEAPAQDTEANTSRQKANSRLFAHWSRICRRQLQQRIHQVGITRLWISTAVSI